MNDNLNAVGIVLIVFIVTIGILFFINITIRNLGKIGRFELLMVIIIFGFSLGYMLSLLSYQESLPKMRDLRRLSDIQLLVNALDNYLDNNDYDTLVIASIPLCPNSKYIGNDMGLYSMNYLLEENYIAEIPSDPESKGINNTLYSICKKETNRIVISALKSELSEIKVIK